MYKVFNIGGVEVEANANAALPFRYQQVFHKDLLNWIGKDIQLSDMMNLAGEILYVTHNAAIKADMNSLSFEGYIEFLETLGNGDLLEEAENIVAFMYESTKSSVSPKAIPGPHPEG